MTDTLTTAKSLVKQTIGGNAATWGTIINSTLDLIDKALGQRLTKALTGNVTLTSTEAQNVGYNFTGALSAQATVTFPTFYGPAFIRNATTGGFYVIVGMASGGTVTIAPGGFNLVFSDGTDFVPGNSPIPAILTASPSNPTTTTSNSAVMMGLGSTCTITPRNRGVIRFYLDVGAIVGTANGGWIAGMRYGTGTAPANGVAAGGGTTGSAIGVNKSLLIADAQLHPMSFSAIVTGLTVGTAYWFDLAVGNVAGGTTAGIQQIYAEAVEI